MHVFVATRFKRTEHACDDRVEDEMLVGEELVTRECGHRLEEEFRRAREIGLRMALGATVRDTMSMILREGGRVALLGVGLGMVLSLAVARLLEGFLFGVSAFDPLVFGTAALLLGGVAVAACVFPARRASRLDPLVALREE